MCVWWGGGSKFQIVCHNFEKEGRRGHQYAELEDFILQEIQAYENGSTTKILHQGIYINHIPKWKRSFAKNLKVIHSNSLNGSNANEALNEITAFLGLDSFDFTNALSKKHNVSPTKKSFPEAEKLLNSFYAPFNEKLSNEYQIAI